MGGAVGFGAVAARNYFASGAIDSLHDTALIPTIIIYVCIYTMP